MTAHPVFDPNYRGVERAGDFRQLDGQYGVGSEAVAQSALRTVTGIVVTGDQRGRTLGFPTANVDLEPGSSELAQGVYAAWVMLDGQLLPGVSAYGKPMFDNREPPLETHIFDFSGDIYGREISVHLMSFMRQSRVFASLDELMVCMANDAEQARDILAANALVLSAQKVEQWRV